MQKIFQEKKLRKKICPSMHMYNVIKRVRQPAENAGIFPRELQHID